MHHEIEGGENDSNSYSEIDNNGNKIFDENLDDTNSYNYDNNGNSEDNVEYNGKHGDDHDEKNNEDEKL